MKRLIPMIVAAGVLGIGAAGAAAEPRSGASTWQLAGGTALTPFSFTDGWFEREVTPLGYKKRCKRRCKDRCTWKYKKCKRRGLSKAYCKRKKRKCKRRCRRRCR